ncbi:unnamed protein product [Paramecium sonneborni]|uniref:Cyclic nucleotide-binding domain-containing protein n=1 Tax=Paramecium sonneborni TaxID=65129 RepID=A0A8S1P8R5_9CILI|nr:unnamed protein product [Paramecium sonneborni]
MNSIYMEVEQYSARVPNEDQALMSRRGDQELRKNEFIQKSNKDRNDPCELSLNEKRILADKCVYSGKIKLESRLQDIDQIYLPFDDVHLDEKERNEKIKELTKSSQSENQRIIMNRKNKQEIIYCFTFNPDNTIKILWDFFCMILILYEIITIPIRISFDIEVSSQFGYVITASFLLDILITFNTAIYKNGNINYSYKEIAIDYLRLWFWIDMISSFPYDLLFTVALTGEAEDEISTSQTNLQKSAQIFRILKFFRFIKVIRLLRLAKLKAIVDKIEEYFSENSIVQTLASFLKLCAFVLFWSHWLGCIFHFIAQSEDSNYNWLVIYGIYEEPWQIRYVNSVYWAVTTMITVGYGDLSPQTPTERLFGVFFLLIACGVFSFTMNTIGNTMQQLSQKQDQYQKRIAEINNYMGKVKIPKQLQNRVRRYLQYLWDTHRSINQESICSNLSVSLKFEFTIQVNGNILANYKLICQTFSRNFLIELTQILIEQTFQPDEYIFIENEIKNEQSLYFIQEGQINIILIKTRQIVARLTNKQIFGEISFFGNTERTASAKSDGFTDIFVLKRNDFIDLLSKFPEDREKFFLINSEVNKNQLQILNIHCYSCDLPGHVIRDCPSLHFVVDLYVYQKTKAKCIQAIMKDFVRKDRINYCARKYNQEITIKAKELQMQIQTHKHLTEDCNVDEIISEGLEDDSIKKGFKLRSKFKEDRNRRRNWEKSVKKSQRQIQQIQMKQQEIFSLTKSLSQAIISSQSSVNVKNTSINQFKNALESDEDSKSDTIIQQKLEDIMADYQIFKEEVEKYNGNLQQEMRKNMQVLTDFEQGYDYNKFYPHNNISVVIDEYNQFQKGNSVKPKIDTEYDSNVFQEYMNYYVIDIDDIRRFKLEIVFTIYRITVIIVQQIKKERLGVVEKTEKIIKVDNKGYYVSQKIEMNYGTILQFNKKQLTDMKQFRDSVSPEVRRFIKQFNNCQRDQKQDKQTSTDESNQSIIQERLDEINIKEMFIRLPNEEVKENKQPYLKISKTPTVSSNNNSLNSIDQDRYIDIIVQKVVEEMERRNNSKRQPMLSIQQNTVQVQIGSKYDGDNYLDDDSFIRQIQQTLLNSHQTPRKAHNFENFDLRQKQFQIQKEQKLQKQRETQQLSKLVDEFKCYLIRTRKSRGL